MKVTIMPDDFALDMREAARLTRNGQVADATALIRRLLAGQAATRTDGRTAGPVIEGGFTRLSGRDADELATASARPAAPSRKAGQFLRCRFANEFGARDYRLYIPASFQGGPAPLVVMLHGCTQTPEDFAVGTRMNEAAEAHACLVAYPAQPASANGQKCWNWFRPGDQGRDAGEPAILAGLTRQIIRDHSVDPSRVYVAGLSAGGAAAGVLGRAYPDLFAAVGVHSGVACGVARDVPSALAAMKSGPRETPRRDPGDRRVPAIIFHGGRDRTVHPRNGQVLAADAAEGGVLSARTEHGRSASGRPYRRTHFEDDGGTCHAEYWLVQDGGHAWFGGSPAGSHTDPRGPDATSEMMRFFLSHRLPR